MCEQYVKLCGYISIEYLKLSWILLYINISYFLEIFFKKHCVSILDAMHMKQHDKQIHRQINHGSIYYGYAKMPCLSLMFIELKQWIFKWLITPKDLHIPPEIFWSLMSTTSCEKKYSYLNLLMSAIYLEYMKWPNSSVCQLRYSLLPNRPVIGYPLEMLRSSMI